MDMEQQIVEALKAELQRQAADGVLNIETRVTANAVTLEGVLDLEAVAMAVVGAVAGGP
jgi:osmotically-inducible protein OsmY